MEIKKVLMVDDDADIRAIGLVCLTRVGKWQASMASRGAEGVEMAAREQPDVILLDVMMPGLDGPATLARLREKEATARIPVIFMTAKVQKHEVERYLSLGAVGVIIKPFDPTTLPDEIRKHLSRHAGTTAAGDTDVS